MLTPPHALPSFFFCKYCCSCPSPRPQASLLSTLNTLIYVQPKVIALRAHIVLRGAAFNDRVRAVLIRSFDQSSFFSPNLKINVFWLKYTLCEVQLHANFKFRWQSTSTECWMLYATKTKHRREHTLWPPFVQKVGRQASKKQPATWAEELERGDH